MSTPPPPPPGAPVPPPPPPPVPPPPPPSVPAPPGYGVSAPPPPPAYGVPPSSPYAAYGTGGNEGGERAGFGVRLGGYLLDGLLYGLLFAPFAIVAGVMVARAYDDCVSFDDEIICPPGAPEAGFIGGAIAVGVVGLILVAVLYVRALGRTGQTWGRKIVGIKVVRKGTGEALGVGRAFGRVLFAGFISSNVCYLGYLWMLWDDDKQTWHDKVVDSVVVRT